ncbi:hypothetical protein HK16_01115 [Acetobacter senegalensis]|uniref:Transglycosylase SLT domain-containing protein n=2 Tax=Acetobacter TaxID=434 RepID=A0A252EEG4_9PROT|nr:MULTISPECIES: hypothetical protein [Acetobacter]ATJ90454.1 hypothetical protein CIW82_06875 [Acetobacter tropicalis]OUL64871.1 hypothetical protein HK16_01115 [Acetobacter senegalensis]
MAVFYWGQGGQPLSQDDIERQYQTANALLQRADNTPATSWAGALGNMLYALSGKFHERGAREGERQNDDYNQDTLAKLLMGGNQQAQYAAPPQASAPGGMPQQSSTPNALAQALINPTTGSASPVAKEGATALITQNLLDHMRQAESGGDAGATNPNSSATGAYQFTSPTWTALMRQHPDLGLTADGRTDPQQSQAAAKQLATDNIAYLLAKGIQNPTEGQTYLAHFAGAPTAANLIQASPDTPVSQVMSPQQIAANPFLRNMTAGQVQDWAAQKMGGSVPSQAAAQNTQYSAPVTAQMPDQPAPQMQSGPSMQALVSVLSDPRANSQTKGIASAMLNNQLQLQQVQQRYQMEQADPENVARRRYYDMETQALQQRMNAPQKSPYSDIVNGQQIGLDPKFGYQRGPDGQWHQVGSSGVNVTLNNGPTTSEFQKKSDDEAATRIGGYIAEGAQAPALIGQLQQLSDLSRNIGTGKGAQFMAAVGPYAQALGVNVKGLDQQQAFTALVDRMAPQMRPVGSGSSSDTDVRMFMNSLPQLGNTDRGNQIIAGTMQALQQNKVQAADIAAQAQRGQISWQDAESQIRKLPNPYEQFKKAHADLVDNSSQGAPQTGMRTTSTGVTWSVR